MVSHARLAFARLFSDPGVTYMLAGAMSLAALSFFTDHSVAARTTVGQAVAPYDACWNALYLLGGLLTLASSIARVRQIDDDGYEIPRRIFSDLRWEAGAIVALTGGFLLNGGTALAIQGLSDIRSYVFAIFVLGGSLRFRRICITLGYWPDRTLPRDRR